MADFIIQLTGKRLTTAQIYYYFPDYPKLLQEFVWQDYDLAPKFPKLHEFIEFWRKDIEGRLHSVYVAGRPLISHAQLKNHSREIIL